MKERGFGVMWLPTEEAESFIAGSDEDSGKVMKEAGLVQQ